MNTRASTGWPRWLAAFAPLRRRGALVEGEWPVEGAAPKHFCATAPVAPVDHARPRGRTTRQEAA